MVNLGLMLTALRNHEHILNRKCLRFWSCLELLLDNCYYRAIFCNDYGKRVRSRVNNPRLWSVRSHLILCVVVLNV